MTTLDNAECHRALWRLVENHWRPNAAYGHGIDHALRVYANGMRFAADEGADPFVVGSACYLIDAGLDLQNGRRDHIS